MKFRLESSDSEDSDGSWGVECLEDLIEPSILDYQELENPDNLKVGDWILVKCKGGSRQSTIFCYVATVLKLKSNGNVKVMGCKSCDKDKKTFVKKENDVLLLTS